VDGALPARIHANPMATTKLDRPSSAELNLRRGHLNRIVPDAQPLTI
jgi:hypothetical protein